MDNKQHNIKRCKCKHEYQDKVYGRGKRVHNETTDPSNRYRCSVCKEEK